MRPADREMRQLQQLGQGRLQVVGREAGLGRVLVDVDLDEDRVARLGP